MQNDLKLHVAAIRRSARMFRRSSVAGLFALLVFVSAPLQPCRAQSYPERAVKLVAAFPPGGPTDIAARLIAHSLSSTLNQNVVVENLVGGGGRIGAKAVASAQPDGHTLLLGGTNINAMFGALYKNLGFDPIGSFAPVAAICVDSMALAVNPGVSANTVKELIDYAKKNPGKLRFGAPSGIYTHFAGEFFKVKTGTDILFVPYKGGAPAITDVIGGHIDMVFNNKSTLLAHFKEGKLRPLAVTSPARWPELPGTPTMKEAGLDGFPTEVLFGVLAPAGTPPAIVEKLNQAINTGLKSAEVGASLAKLGMEARIGTPQAFAASLAEQVREWANVVDATGVKGE